MGREEAGGAAVAVAPPKAWAVRQAEEDGYAARADRIAIRNPMGEVVAVIEIVSPGNKSSRAALRAFVEKAAGFVRNGVNLLIVDLFPPSVRVPQGIHPEIWGEFKEEPFGLPEGKTGTVVSYVAGPVRTAYIEPVGFGDRLPEMPVFLTPHVYVPTPLEATYETTWSVCPRPLREAVTGS